MKLIATSVAIALGSGCTHWVPVPLADLSRGKTEVRTRDARIDDDVGRVHLRIDRLDLAAGGALEGWAADAKQELRIEFSTIHALEVELPDRQATGLAVFLTTFAGLSAIAFGILAALFSGIG